MKIDDRRKKGHRQLYFKDIIYGTFFSLTCGDGYLMLKISDSTAFNCETEGTHQISLDSEVSILNAYVVIED